MEKDFQVFAAPLAGITDRPFRTILRRLNPGLKIMTEMISCHSITGHGGGRNDDTYFDENTGAQIFGADPKLMADAARILADRGAAWIDINMGCPVPKVATRAGAGAFLMRDHRLAGQITAAVARAVKIPVSIKTRLGWDDAHLDSVELIRIAADNGAKWAAVHGRTRAMGYAGVADWNAIADLVTPRLDRGGQAKIALPIIFNGDIKNAADISAVRALGAMGAMIGRAMLGRPDIFNPKPGAVNSELILEHLELMIEYYGERAAIPMFRKHAAWYATGRSGAAAFRTRANGITTAAEMRGAVKDFFQN
ncbi:MAG: tRNA-dihydrouridine synthase [Rickettsiales bacterium]|jgi:tRNA-dihydrouridine synthase B|nr:tRNA-dihydrouridine synthase [Rickettsiales bacterium]